MMEDSYQDAIDYFANEIVKRLKRHRNFTRNDQESQMTDDLDAFCEDIAAEVSKKMGWEQYDRPLRRGATGASELQQVVASGAERAGELVETVQERERGGSQGGVVKEEIVNAKSNYS